MSESTVLSIRPVRTHTVTLPGTSSSGTIADVGIPDFSTGRRSRSTTSILTGSSQPELTINRLSGQLGAHHPDDTAAHDIRTAELARHKLGRLTADDADGYHRVACPAAAGKLRCPLRPASMTLDRSRPEILTPPQHPPACCTRQTLTHS